MTEPTVGELVVRVEEMDRRYTDRFTLSDRAIDKAEMSMNKRLDGMNEFRDALKDQSSRMATRAEVEALNATVESIRRDNSKADGRNVVVAGVVSLMGGVLVAWLSSLLRGN